MWPHLLVLLLISFAKGGVNKECVAKLPDVLPVPRTWCGSDGQTWLSRKTPQMLFPCGLFILYPGPCGCPSYCSNFSDQGQCQNDACMCKPGWKGADCSIVDCASGNSCSGHGQCKTVGDLDICVCQPGFTGPYCQQNSLPLEFSKLPWGQVLGPKDYWKKDKYGDEHPVFNRTVVATVHIKIPEASLNLLRDPTTMNDYPDGLPADIFFDNGVIQFSQKQVGLKIKGFSSRSYAKKSWKIAFDEFGGSKVYGLAKLGLKANSQDPSGQRGVHESDLLRSVGIPSARNSWAYLFVNNLDFGMFWLEEIIDKTFLNSRFGNKDGNMYKVGGGMLQYIGNDPIKYKEYPPWGIPGILPGEPYAYRLKYGKDDSFRDLMNLCIAINSTLDVFPKTLPDFLNVEEFMRSIMVVSTVVNIDCFSLDGNNWMMYFDTASKVFRFITSDFDLGFNLIETAHWPEDGKNITSAFYSPLQWGTKFPIGLFPQQFIDLLGLPNPLTTKVIATWKTEFIQNYQTFVAKAFGSPINNLQERTKTFGSHLAPFYKQDRWYFLDTGLNFDLLNYDVHHRLLPFIIDRQLFLSKLFGK